MCVVSFVRFWHRENAEFSQCSASFIFPSSKQDYVKVWLQRILDIILFIVLSFFFKVRGLEAQGVPSKQAEAITAAITEVLNDSLENVAHSFVSKAEMQKVSLSKFGFQFCAPTVRWFYNELVLVENNCLFWTSVNCSFGLWIRVDKVLIYFLFLVCSWWYVDWDGSRSKSIKV